MKPMTIATLISWGVVAFFLAVAGALLAVDSGETGMNFGYAFALMTAGIAGLVAVCLSIISIVQRVVAGRK